MRNRSVPSSWVQFVSRNLGRELSRSLRFAQAGNLFTLQLYTYYGIWYIFIKYTVWGYGLDFLDIKWI